MLGKSLTCYLRAYGRASRFPSLSSGRIPSFSGVVSSALIHLRRHVARWRASRSPGPSRRAVLDVVLMSAGYADRATSTDASLPETPGAPRPCLHRAPSVRRGQPVRTPSGSSPSPRGSRRRSAPRSRPHPRSRWVWWRFRIRATGHSDSQRRRARATGVLTLGGTAHPAGWKALRGAMSSISTAGLPHGLRPSGRRRAAPAPTSSPRSPSTPSRSRSWTFVGRPCCSSAMKARDCPRDRRPV